MRVPKLFESIDDPVVLVQEEGVDGGETRLYDSSAVPTSEVVWSWVAASFLRAAKTTLASAR